MQDEKDKGTEKESKETTENKQESKKEKEKTDSSKSEDKAEKDKKEIENESKTKTPEPDFEMIENPARVMNVQKKVISITADSRYKPLKPVSNLDLHV